jgi:chemotaxis-related protein WspD
MPAEAPDQRTELLVVNDCWNQIGVKGDGTCPELAKVVHCRNCPVFAAAGQTLFAREPPAEYVEEWTAALAREEASAACDTVAVLTFRIGEEWLALDVQSLAEVSGMRMIRRVPQRTDRLLLGLVNIRGELHLCIKLAELLGIEDVTGHGERLLIAGQPPRRWAFAVDEVAGVQRVSAQDMGNVPSTVAHSLAHFSLGVFAEKNKRIGYLSAERLFKVLNERIG